MFLLLFGLLVDKIALDYIGDPARHALIGFPANLWISQAGVAGLPWAAGFAIVEMEVFFGVIDPTAKEGAFPAGQFWWVGFIEAITGHGPVQPDEVGVQRQRA